MKHDRAAILVILSIFNISSSLNACAPVHTKETPIHYEGSNSLYIWGGGDV